MSEIFWRCEVCDTPICDGDRYHETADGCSLCEEHAPMLSDIIRQHEEFLGRVPFDVGDLEYESRDDMKQALEALKEDMAFNGDRKMLMGGAAHE